ncbi:30S ribosomal protein S8 [Candidatus Micrarchaeota archaeon CG08_land_8_20_14_0_20_49_17]|nr:MAG: 30S ribosomal protein S8 [Candidatus Micrarchaeota archaeon CG08_land_8_20_14_0_20_49_17]PIZ98198.1 MAG: 30S ribosomal protein S8 [Candidatus Micrarchaeota archaeon CG_4_10_14_0_2_um_filter_49_7]HII53288.1 30S ribosomal protein S8 [Candidatus Micrarchaeota archaeon]
MADLFADMLNVVKTSERANKRECFVRRSALILLVLKLLQENNYVGDIEIVDESKGGKVKVALLSRINDCSVIKPRMSVKVTAWPEYESLYLPAPTVGLLIVSTPAGVITNRAAREKKIGGRLLAYVY